MVVWNYIKIIEGQKCLWNSSGVTPLQPKELFGSDNKCTQEDICYVIMSTALRLDVKESHQLMVDLYQLYHCYN